MKKILYFIDDLSMGGIQKLALDWVSKFDKDKISVDFLLLDEGKSYELENVFKKMNCKIYKLENIWIRKSWDYLKYNIACNNFFKNHHDYDIIELHSSSKNYVILKFAKKYGIKTRISHSHNIGFQTKNKIKILVGNIFKKKLIKYSTDFLACSVDAGKWLFGPEIINSDRFEVIYNSIDFDKFKYNRNTRNKIRKKLNISNDEFIIGHIGRFNEQKNHQFLINLFEKIHNIKPNSKLLLLGEGNLKTSIENLVKEKKLEKSVIFAGIKTNANEYLQAMDNFVFPSLYEGLGIVLIEAQAAGLKIFTSKNVVPIEARISNNFYYIKLNTANYDEWVEKILNEDYNYNRNEVKIDKKNYDINTTVNKLERYYLSRGD